MCRKAFEEKLAALERLEKIASKSKLPKFPNF